MVGTKRLFWRSGLSVAAALMLSGAALAQDASGGGPAVDVVVQNSDDITPAVIDVSVPEEGIAVGEPDPTGGGMDPGAGDGSGDGTDPGAGDGTDPGLGDGTDPGVGDWTDPGVGDGTDPGVGDGTDPGVGDGSVDGSDPAAGDGSGATDGGMIDYGTVTIYSMDGGPATCDVCAESGVASPNVAHTRSEVERHLTHDKGATDVVAQIADTPSVAARSVAARSVVVPGSQRDVARQPVSHASAACLGEHPGLAWMCEWQSAGQ